MRVLIIVHVNLEHIEAWFYRLIYVHAEHLQIFV